MAPKKKGNGGESSEARLRRELTASRLRETESRAREAASAAILKVIRRSPHDAQPAFDAIARSAVRLCEGRFGLVFRYDGETLHFVAHQGFSRKALAVMRSRYPRAPVGLIAESIRRRTAVHTADVFRDPRVAGHKIARAQGYRSFLCVPMLRGDEPIGVIAVQRREAEAFADHHIAVLETFADQAVIAIDNARLFRETREALERQTATADILNVIASSPTDVQPVFEVIARSAQRLFGARNAVIVRRIDDMLHLVAYTRTTKAGDAALKKLFPTKLTGQAATGKAIATGKPTWIVDVETDPGYSESFRAGARARGYRSLLVVPMMLKGTSIGAINVTRPEPGEFSTEQIKLLKTFADQAVIAIENARGFRETKEALERQTATAEILKVIASSPSDVQPVFEAIATRAALLSQAKFAYVTTYDGEWIHLRATFGPDAKRHAAGYPIKPGGAAISGRVVRDRAPVQIEDVLVDREYAHKDAAKVTGFRGGFGVPMMRDGQVLGAIVVARPEPGRVPEQIVAILQTFADQAVIAIENVRLFNETKEALERQTATAEILKVIASSPSDVQPVFDAIIDSAMRLMKAWSSAVLSFDGEMLHLRAARGSLAGTDEFLRKQYPRPLGTGSLAVRCIREKTTCHLTDALADPDPGIQKTARERQYRSALAVPLLKGGEPIGSISVSRVEAGGFRKAEVELLQTFADQAVIAIDNVRLFNETREALERQTATAEILRVISSTPADTQPVFDAIVQTTQRLIRGKSTVLLLRSGEEAVVAGYSGEGLENLPNSVRKVPLDRTQNYPSRAILDGEVVHVPDWEAADVLEFEKQVGKSYGVKAGLQVPLLRKGEGIGVIVVFRGEAGPFHEKEIALLKSFADQAVIAIENARLFNETKEALERQTATAEILKVIASSPSDVQPVFDSIAASALRLCEGSFSVVSRFDGQLIHLAAMSNVLPGAEDAIRSLWPIPAGRKLATARAIAGKRAVQIPDIREDADYDASGAHEVAKFRAVLAVPMLRDGVPIGAINVNRPEPGPFPQHQIELLKTFADQAVIAIENVRLFNETKESLERQTATAEILKVIASSPSDVQPVFEAIARNALTLCGSSAANVYRYDGTQMHFVASSQVAPELVQLLYRGYPRPPDRSRATGRAILSKQMVRIEDALADPDYDQSVVAASGWRRMFAVPMLREGEPIGAIALNWPEPGPIPSHQEMLLRTFADQAVIAIENVRLFNETKEALERQTATAEILRVLGRSMTDTQPVFDAIVNNCHQLFKDSGVMLRLAADGQLHVKANVDYPMLGPVPIDRTSAIGVCVVEGRTVHLPDLEEAAKEFPRIRQLGLKYGYHSGIYAPLIHGGKAIGAMSVLRRELGAFDEKDVQLFNTFADQAVIAIENVRLFNETKEALERQTATAEILKVISGSPTDVQPVFDAIVKSALRLFSGQSVGIILVDGDRLQIGSVGGEIDLETARKRYPLPLNRETVAGQAILDRSSVNIADTEAPGMAELLRVLGREIGYRAIAAAPMMREGAAMGAIAVLRKKPGALNQKEVALLQTFADQAVIAIENVRLFRELEARNRDVTDALEQQTATADILRVISSSPTNVQPVFDAIVQSGLKIFAETSIGITVADGDSQLVVASGGNVSQIPLGLRVPRSRESATGMAVVERTVVNIRDTEAPDAPLYARENGRALGFRAIAALPLLREGESIGAISLLQKDPGGLSDKQVALLRSFADQAVIAIENVRLFNETKEALERQTATAEILKVISNSPADTQPVFEAIVQSGLMLFPNAAVGVALPDGGMVRAAALAAPDTARAEQWKARFPFPLSRDYMHGVALLDRRLIDVPDAEVEKEGPLAVGVRNFLAGGYRAGTFMPMLRGGEAIGVISVLRVAPGPLGDNKIELLRTFADQAVIAIENVRLFNETREALERQTATGEVLAAMSGSMTDTQPVFEKIVQSLRRLFGTRFTVLQLLRDGVVEMPAVDGVGIERLRERYPRPLDETTVGGRAMLTKQAVQFAPVLDNPETPLATIQFAKDFDFNSVIFTPMIHEGRVVGAIGAAHSDAKPFDERQIALIKTFAAQAVIAIENVRLFNETKEALERQTATAEILKVIASSPSDVQPVFDAIAKSAYRLIGGFSTAVARVFDDVLHLVAFSSTGESGNDALKHAFPMPISRSKAARTATPVCIDDTEALPESASALRELARTRGFRSIVIVPMLREGVASGTISVTRREPGEFSSHQVELLKTFADQAVIAIENVRLFNETKESLERQTATAEILKVIASSPSDVQPVFDAIVRAAARLFDRKASLRIVEGDGLRRRAWSWDESTEFHGADLLPISEISLVGRVVLEAKAMQVADKLSPDAPPYARENAARLDWRSIASGPLLRDGKAIGCISVSSPEPGPLSDKQMALLATFADQAVIAIENVRLFKELQSRTEALTKSVGQLTALGEVGQAISSTLEVETVLETIVQHAVKLTGLDGGSIYEYDEVTEAFSLQASENIEPELVEAVRTSPVKKGEGAIGRCAETLEPVQVADIMDASYHSGRKDILIRAGYRAVLAVPLLREDHLLGALQVFRRAPGPFAPEIVELLKTFATQSAMAIQNARLFREIAEKGRELEVASRHKSQFLASMSHELRTPLNAILGFNEMILGEIYGPVPGDMKGPLTDIQTSGKHLLRLINNVLDLAKIEAGRMELALGEYSVQDTVEGVRSTLRPLAAEKGLDFVATVPVDLPLAYGDAGRITQCLMNLAGNSLKFTKQGKVEITVLQQNGLLRYSVSDTGMGIPADKIANLFTEFKQTDSTIASEYGGTGLGLSISKKFVEMHGGRIWVESEVGKGSAFIFEIPLRANS